MSQVPLAAAVRESGPATASPFAEAVCAWVIADPAFREGAKRILRSEIEAAVQQMRNEGVAPERVIVQIKERTRAACAGRQEGMPATQVIDSIVSDVVQWSIAEYYRVT